MTEQEINELINNGEFQGEEPTSLQTIDGHICINNLIALPVSDTDCSHNRNIDLEIQFDNGTDTGTLCYCKSQGHAENPYQQLSEWRRVAFLTEARKMDWGTDYYFSQDFLVLPKDRITEYKNNYLATAPIWGGFLHKNSSSEPSVFRSKTKIKVRGGIKIPTQFHTRLLQYSVRAAHPYDRFLRQYHQLELLFDWIFVRKIQQLGDDLEGVAKLMSEYSSGDLPRLKVILIKFVNNANNVRDQILIPSPYLNTAKEIFDINNKDGNPLKDKWDRFMQWHAQGMTEESAKNSTIKILGDKSFSDFVITIAAYWIYRVRCSIAHNRIGEYIMKESDEEFIVHFMEPLLLEVLCQVFSHPDLP